MCIHLSSFVVVRYWLILPACFRVISLGQEQLIDCQCQWSIGNMREWYIDGLVQDYSNSSALAMELLQSCAKPSICTEQSRTQSCAFCWDILYPMKSSMNLLLFAALRMDDTPESWVLPLVLRCLPDWIKWKLLTISPIYITELVQERHNSSG